MYAQIEFSFLPLAHYTTKEIAAEYMREALRLENRYINDGERRLIAESVIKDTIAKLLIGTVQQLSEIPDRDFSLAEYLGKGDEPVFGFQVFLPDYPDKALVFVTDSAQMTQFLKNPAGSASFDDLADYAARYLYTTFSDEGFVAGSSVLSHRFAVIAAVCECARRLPGIILDLAGGGKKLQELEAKLASDPMLHLMVRDAGEGPSGDGE